MAWHLILAVIHIFLLFVTERFVCSGNDEITYSADQLTTVCEGDHMTYSCGQNEVIFITSAIYGRMSQSTCIESYPGTMNCVDDVLPQLDRWCSGRPNCSLTLNPDQFPVPCRPGYNMYLTTSHRCINVQKAEHECAVFGKAYALFRDGIGYLSSWVAKAYGCGNVLCPWEIHTTSDNIINITLYDFGSDLMRSGTLDNIHGCRKYVTIQEIDEEHVGQDIVICRGFKRKRHVFLSRGRKVKVTFYHEFHKLSHFILEYTAVKKDINSYEEKNEEYDQTFKFSILMVVAASLFLGIFAIVIAFLYTKLMKEVSKRYVNDEASSKAEMTGTKPHPMRRDAGSHKQLYKQVHESNKRYSYIWETLDEDSLTYICTGQRPGRHKTKDHTCLKSNPDFDLPEVILIVDEQHESKSNSRKMTSA